MKVYLPSNGMMGLHSVELRPPKLNDLREVPNMGPSSIIKKTQFCHLLAGDDIYKITPSDRDYLFIIALGAVTMNTLGMMATCSCGHVVRTSISLSDLNPLRIERGVKPSYRLSIGKEKFYYRKLTVKDELEVEERAIDLPDEDYDKEFQDGIVAKTLFDSLSPETIERVRNLDLSIYMSAILYQSINPHGISLLQKVECPKCKKEISAHLPITGDMLNVDVAQILQRYVSLRTSVSLEGFFDLTLSELNTIVRALNQELRK